MNISEQEKSFSRVLRAIEAVKNEGMVIMVDEEDRENEGDIVFAADLVTPEKINFMVKEARGLICLALDADGVERLELPMMRDRGKSGCSRETAFTVSIEARHGVTTGISAADRARTIQVAVDPKSTPDDLVVPGHIFPLKAKAGGVLERAGHTEGSVDLAKLAGLSGAAVICEIMKDDGSMARMPELKEMSKKYDIPLLTIPDLIQYRLMKESLVSIESDRVIRTAGGDLRAVLFSNKMDQAQSLALVKGEIDDETVVDVRVHMQRPLVDVLAHRVNGGARRLDKGFEILEQAKAGVFLYLGNSDHSSFAQDVDEMFAQANGEEVCKPSPRFMDQRQVGVGCQILRQLGVRKMRVFSSSEKPYKGLSGFGLEVTQTEII